MTLADLLDKPQYSLPQADKEAALLSELNALTARHRAGCPGYARILEVMHPGFRTARSLEELPYLPVGLFKSQVLRSVPEEEVWKTLLSSGTTGQRPSTIVLDRETSQLQTLALSRIMTHVLGPRRLPMIVADHAGLVKDPRRFNARAAGAVGMMTFGRDHFHALDEQLELDRPGLEAFLARFGGQPFLIFGFTFVVWKHFLGAIAGTGLDLSQGILVHSGGWKKLVEEAVSPQEFRRRVKAETGLSRIYNFYGMVEQVGSVFLEGKGGHLYPPSFADVIIRDPATLLPLPTGQPGVIQVLSALPRSYPGHSLLTEDLGVVHHVDGGAGGRLGKAISVLGRLPRAELRGCSDVVAAQAG